MKHLIYLLVILMNLTTIGMFSQSITTLPLDSDEYCVGNEIDISFTANGTYENDNIFIAQISNDNFDTFVNMGHLQSTTSGTITTTIPGNLEYSENYRIRVISDKPYISGSDNGSDLTIYTEPDYSPKIYANNEENDQLFFERNADINFHLNLDANYVNDPNWDFGNDAVPSTHNGYAPPSVKFTTKGAKNISFDMKYAEFCNKSASANMNLRIVDCEVEIDPTAYVDSVNISGHRSDSSKTGPGLIPFGDFHHVWILPIGSIDGKMIMGWEKNVFIIETGGSVLLNNASECVFYLKPGASLEFLEILDNCAIIRSPEASVKIDGQLKDNNLILNCPNINFVYNKAPKTGVEILKRLGYLAVDDESDENQNLRIYPNPATDRIYLELNTENWQLSTGGMEIYNTFGEKMSNVSANILGEKIAVDVSGLNPGMYFLSYSTMDGKFVEKFVVVR